MHLVARHNAPLALAAGPKPWYYRSQTTPLGRLFMTKQVVHVSDLAAEKSYTEQHDAGVSAAVELGGVGLMLAVPMLKENELVVRSFYFAKKSFPSPTSRSSCFRTLVSRPSSPSKTRGCSTNCVNRSINRRRRPTCSRLSATPPSICKPYLIRLPNSRRQTVRDNKGAIWQRDGVFLRLIANYRVPPGGRAIPRRASTAGRPEQRNRAGPSRGASNSCCGCSLRAQLRRGRL